MDASEKPGSSADGAGGAAEGGAKSRRQTYDCNICFEDVVEPVVTRCGHLFCWACLLTWMNRPNDHCPVCHAGISKANVIPLYGRGQDSSDGRSKPAEPRPAAERPEPQPQQQSGGGTMFGGVALSFFTLPITLMMPFQMGGYSSYGLFNLVNTVTDTQQMTPEQRRAHINSLVLIVLGLAMIAYILVVM